MLEAPPTALEAVPPRVIDLRGAGAPVVTPSVLVDPTGRRARRLRVAGRALGTLFLLWLCGLLLAGLGLVPVSDIPFASSFRAAQEPAQLTKLPAGKPGSAADLRSARPLSALSEGAGSIERGARSGAASARSAAEGGGSPTVGSGTRRQDPARAGGNHRSSHVTTGSPSSSTPAPGNSSATPAATGTTPSTSNAGSTHSHGSGSTTTTSGGGGSANGQSGAPHGSSDSAPGHDPTRTTGHGKSSG